MSPDRRTIWEFTCRLNRADFYLLSFCNPREFEELQKRVGERCPLCGAPIDVIDVATKFANSVARSGPA